MKINGFYPNPSNGRFKMDIANFPGGKGTIRVFNLLGQEIYSRGIQSMPLGRHFINLDLNTMKGIPTGSGMVFVRVEASEEQIVKKCIILKN